MSQPAWADFIVIIKPGQTPSLSATIKPVFKMQDVIHITHRNLPVLKVTFFF